MINFSYKRIEKHVGALALFSLISSFWLFPLSFHIFECLPAGHDSWLFLWNFWWTGKALFELHISPFFCDYVFYPVGVSLYFHAATPLNSLVGFAVQTLSTPAFAFNFIFVSSFILSGYFAFLLAYRLTGSSIAGLFAGYIYAFSPFRFSHIDQLEHLSTQWPALLAFTLFLLIEKKTISISILAAISFSAVFYTNIYYGVFSSVMVLCFFFYDFFFVKDERKKTVRVWIIFAAASSLLCGPFVWKMLELAGEQGRFIVPMWVKSAQSLDLLMLITPSLNNPFVADNYFLEKIYLSFTAGEKIGYLGISVILLSIYGLVKKRDKLFIFVFAMSSIFVILALGPFLHVGGLVKCFGFPVPLPQLALQILPGIGEARVPARYLSIAMIFISLSAAHGISELLRSNLKYKRIVIFISALVLILEFWNKPLDLVQPRTPAWCRILASDPRDCSVIDLPLQISEEPAEWWKSVDPATDHGWLQTLYNKRTLTGTLSHTALTKSNFLFLLNSKIVSQLSEITKNELTHSDAERELQRLRLTYFILHKDIYLRIGEDKLKRDKAIIEDELFGRKIYEDDEFMIFKRE
ncbi:TPA: hypothetical protein DEF17_03910 [bacterium]|nr:MAG: hypothetical protein COS94_01495 [Candidatus Hydrogenedentes bacterium CG07_land_8_20_14_0_80_42_17]HBW47061.1 hypothetical protein [bacterium]